MSAPLSVIIPTLNAADRLGPCLGALGEAVMEGLIREVILTDGGSDDAIAEIAEATGAVLITAPRGRGTQLDAGARAAHGPWLLFLHADTVLGPGWADAIRTHIRTSPGRAGYFRLRFDAAGTMARLVETGANLRARLFRLPYGDQGLLLEKSLYQQVGGYPAIPLMEDVVMSRQLGCRLQRLRADALTSAERYQREGWVRRPLRNLGTLVRHLMGTPSEHLVDRYEKR